MEKGILLRISRPYKVLKTTAASAVVLPAVNGDVTILPERAPTMFLLGNGMIQVLDHGGKAVDRYFVKGGIADVARNRCAVSTGKAVTFDSMTVEKATRKRDESIYQEDKDFYQMIVDKLTLLKRD